jgi:hypothetical protein
MSVRKFDVNNIRIIIDYSNAPRGILGRFDGACWPSIGSGSISCGEVPFRARLPSTPSGDVCLGSFMLG